MPERRRAAIAAAIVFAATLAVYASMLPAGPGTGDEAEAQTVPYILGIMHPTGFPAYTLAGWVWSHALPLGTVAWRLNAFTAACTALSAAGIVLLAVAIGSGVLGAVFAALAFACGNLVWTGAIHANAQPLSTTCSVYALVGAVVFARSGSARALVAACAACGSGMATHPTALWSVPAIVVAVLWQRKATSRRTLAAAFAALVLPLLLYTYLPLRSAAIVNPGATIGQPSLDPTSLDWEPVGSHTPAGFANTVLGTHDRAPSRLLRALDPRVFPNAARSWLRIALEQYRLALLVLAAIGCAALAWGDCRALSVLAAGTLGGVTFAYVYNDTANLARYYAVSFAVTAAVAAASTRVVLPRLPPNAARIAATLALAVLAALALAGDRPHVLPSFSPLSPGDQIVAAVKRDTPDNAIVVAEWQEANALRYGSFVEHALGSRSIVAAWVGQYYSHYPQWIRTRPVILYVGPGAMDGLVMFGPRARMLPSSLQPFVVLQVLPKRPRP